MDHEVFWKPGWGRRDRRSCAAAVLTQEVRDRAPSSLNPCKGILHPFCANSHQKSCRADNLAALVAQKTPPPLPRFLPHLKYIFMIIISCNSFYGMI